MTKGGPALLMQAAVLIVGAEEDGCGWATPLILKLAPAGMLMEPSAVLVFGGGADALFPAAPQSVNPAYTLSP